MRLLPLFVVVASLVACGSDEGSPNPAPDTRTQALAYARDDLACTTEADCCVVFDGCRANGLIVASTDRAKVVDLLKSAPSDLCVKCIAPGVQVKCTSGKCSGVAITAGSGADINAGEPFRQNHCGTLAIPSGWVEPQSAAIRSNPGISPMKVIGCGS